MKPASLKITLLLAFFTLAIFFPIGGPKSFIASLIAIVVCFIGGMCYPYIAQMDYAMGQYIIQKPIWNDKLSLIKPLTISHLIAYLLLFSGSGIIIGELIQTQSSNFIGFCLIAAGFGVIFGNAWAVSKKDHQ